MTEKRTAQRQQRLLQILDRFPGVRLALWGDLVVDEFIEAWLSVNPM